MEDPYHDCRDEARVLCHASHTFQLEAQNAIADIPNPYSISVHDKNKTGVCAESREGSPPPSFLLLSSTHLILTGALCCPHRIICSQLVGYLHIQITLILLIRFILQDASDLLSSLYSEHFP
jgi:hypothetical protein